VNRQKEMRLRKSFQLKRVVPLESFFFDRVFQDSCTVESFYPDRPVLASKIDESRRRMRDLRAGDRHAFDALVARLADSPPELHHVRDLIQVLNEEPAPSPPSYADAILKLDAATIDLCLKLATTTSSTATTAPDVAVTG
jgi:hypothetical protein